MLLMRDEEQDEGQEKRDWYSLHREEDGKKKKTHLSRDLKETKSSKYSQVIAAGKKIVGFGSF